jgi:ribosomal protein S18 acetylase RimI-like enzyme
MTGILGVTVENVVVGLTTTAIIGSMVLMKDRILNYYIEMQYPIAGSYITTFQDDEDGETVKRRAPAELEQTGRQVEGVTSLPGDDREWVLEGEISTNGYVNGVYRAIDPHDQGVGNFFLYINHDRRMEGTWSGYDEVNRKITSGRYVFVPKLNDFTIRDAKPSDVPAIVDIADQQLGKDYLTSEIVESSLDSDSPYFTKVAVTDQPDTSIRDVIASRVGRDGLIPGSNIGVSNLVPGRIVGFCLGAVFTPTQLDEYLHVDMDELPEAMRAPDKISVIRTIAVSEEYHGRGIGTELIQNSIDHCRQKESNVICSIGWREDGQVNIGGVLERLDFNRIAEYDEYWKEHSLEEGYSCQSCGDPPCTCSAVLFAKYQ